MLGCVFIYGVREVVNAVADGLSNLIERGLSMWAFEVGFRGGLSRCFIVRLSYMSCGLSTVKRDSEVLVWCMDGFRRRFIP